MASKRKPKAAASASAASALTAAAIQTLGAIHAPWEASMNADGTVGIEAHGVADGEHTHDGVIATFRDGRLISARPE